MAHVVWHDVTRNEMLRAIQEYDRLGPEGFFTEHGFGPTTTYELVWAKRRYPPKGILGTAYEFATGQRLGSGDFEDGKNGAVAVGLPPPGHQEITPVASPACTASGSRPSGWRGTGTC